MNLVKCENGHYFDEERYPSCPHCAAPMFRDDNLTVAAVSNASNDAVTVAVDSNQVSEGGSLKDAVKAATSTNDEKTMGFFKETIGIDPVVGWLVCTKGEHFGEDFKLKSGRNFIGRSATMDIALLKDASVSRNRHAVVLYEPRGNLFIVQPGDSKELSYLNGEVVLAPQEIKTHDRLTVGKSELMFVPCCSDEFNWDDADEENK